MNGSKESSHLLSVPSEHYRATPTSQKPEDDSKLDTFNGVFVPTSLNVISILMFLRFGFIVGQLGILGSLGMLVLSYVIDSLTVMSVSAIATNGTVKGGGAYYMISRSLGPEFGGAIGIIFFIGQILNSALNVVGFVEPLLVNFGKVDGDLFPILPIGYFWQLLYCTILLALCTGIAMVGSNLVSKAGLWLFIVLLVSIILIPISSIVPQTYVLDVPYTIGINWTTIQQNLYPNFTKGAAGSVLDTPETFRNLFGIFFPATSGIFAGASMSGSLKDPSKSIPLGTIRGLLLTFWLYAIVILCIGSSVPRPVLYKDIKVIQSVSLQGYIIILGELSTALFSVIMGLVSAGELLTAIANDKIIPGLSFMATFKKPSRVQTKSKVYAIFVTWFLAQMFLFADINQIAVFVTMAFLMTFIVTNLACFLLKIGSAPNFRPKFKYFNSRTAFTGLLTAVIAMFIVDGMSATFVILLLAILIITIHYTTPVSKFGDISQLLIYHQVRKYLLRLKLNMSVKYWRPQILLLCDNPRSGWNLIGFCNHLKKGGLYILGHVVILNDDTLTRSAEENDSEFSMKAYKEVQKQKKAWVKLRDLTNVKAFVQIALGPTLPWGVRNVYLGSGLGGMRPNITVIGFYDFVKHGLQLPLHSFQSKSQFDKLPTDDCRQEQQVSINQWVQVIEDLIIMQSSVAVASNFNALALPNLTSANRQWWNWSTPQNDPSNRKRYIDLYPIQMSNINVIDGKSILSTNFDTYSLILQLGSILSTVPEWKYTNHVLRIIVFVENELEIDEEKSRVNDFLSTLRIDAKIKAVCLNDGQLHSYNYIVKGYTKNVTNRMEFEKIDRILKNEQWWKNLQNARETLGQLDKQKVRKKQVYFNQADFEPLGLNKPSIEINNEVKIRTRRDTMSNLHDRGLALSFNINRGMLPDVESSSDDDTETDLELTPRPSVSDLGANASAVAYKPPAFDKLRLKDDQISIKSSRSNLRPNFVSVKTPQALLVNDEDEDGIDDDDADKPSIAFVDDDTLRDKDDYFTIKKGSISKPKSSGLKSPSIISNDDGIIHQLRTPKFLALDDNDDIPSVSSSFTNLADLNTPRVVKSASAHQRSELYKRAIPHGLTPLELNPKFHLEEERAQEETILPKNLQAELKNLSFDDIPAKGQHIILNELMKRHSPKPHTEVVFSTLPAPSLNTHLDDGESFEYVNNLAIWMNELPPVILFNSQTVTVTTEL